MRRHLALCACRADVFVRLPPQLVVMLGDGDGAQPPAPARSAGALACGGNIHGSVGRAHQVHLARLEELAFGPVQFDGYVGAAVQVAVCLAGMADDEAGGVLAAGRHGKAHALAAVLDGCGLADQDVTGRCRLARHDVAHCRHAFSLSHWCSSGTVLAENTGRHAVSWSTGWAPYSTAMPADPAFWAISRSCVVSPIITVRFRSWPSSRVSSCNMAGCGLEKVSSAQRVASKVLSSFAAFSARFRPTRLLPVATARK